MKSLTLKTGLLAVAMATLFTGCNNNDDPQPNPEGESKYVLITMSDNTLNKPGYATAFDAIPSGNVANNGSNSTQGMGFGGWRPYGNWLLKMFSTESNALGIERLKVGIDGTVSSDNFIAAADNTTNGSGNFVIVNETSGYYWDGSKPFAIQTFNPTTMTRTDEIDLSDAVNERGEGEAGIKFRSIGQKFLAVKGGKLYANITYASGTTNFPLGYWDDFYEDVYLAVIDIATGKYEKTIEIEDTGSIAYVNDNNMYDFDTNGDLYIVTQGVSPTGTGGKSKISRIKANETDIDKTWSLNMDDIQTGGKFVSVFAKDGKIITVIPNTALTGGPNGNINFEDVWEFYSIDIASKDRTKISGIPAVTNPGAAFCAIELDDKILLRVTTKDGSKNGYFEYDAVSNSATELFKVTSGGSVSGLHKVQIGN